VCEGGDRAAAIRAVPRPAPGVAVDPITLTPVDEVTVTVLVDNTFDGLLIGDERVRRPSFTAGRAPAPQFLDGTTMTGLLAEHGFGALVTVRRGDHTTSVLFDSGMSPDALVTNADRLQVDLTAVQGIVLSHGHFDHAGGFPGLARLRRRHGLPITVHPLVWTPRRVVFPGQVPWELPILRRSSLEAEGFECWLLNARHVKNVPGRPKTDKLDAVWLAKVAERGMCAPSLVHPKPIRQLRDLTRYRRTLIRERAREKQRLEKILEDAQIKLSAVVSDLFGVSGRAMIEALIAGQRSP